MDFFTHQDVARKKTSLLVFYFFVAVAMIVLAVYLAVMAIFVVAQAKAQAKGGQPIGAQAWWNPQLLPWIAGVTAAIVALGSLYKISQLRGGGETVARMLGGRPVNPNTTDLDERVLLNVVEEMAVASGVPVPPVYVMDNEGGINAFAAGFTPNDAVIGVTRGTLETLTRDELQGVIAHEFSHILNGDMRLNIRLIGVLHGILLIAIIGYHVLRNAPRAGGGKNKAGGAAAMFLLGTALLVIGYVGVFFGKLIKSAVSRQREFLADSSAVQFTRNPAGIGDALRKIGGVATGSRVKHAEAEEASHMFFGNALGASFINLMATHPPLPERIRRIDPSFDGTFPDVTRVQRTARDLARDATAAARGQQASAVRARMTGKTQAEARAAAFAFQPAAAVASVGTLDPDRVNYAAGLIESLPDRLVKAVHEPLGAVATICCLLLDNEPDARRRQVQFMVDHADKNVYQEFRRVLPVIDQVGPETRLPIVEMCVPALCQLSGVQFQKLCETVLELVEADQEISPFEFALQRMLMRHLAPRFVRRKPPGIKYQSLEPLIPSVAGLLSTLAYTGNRDAGAAERAFAAGARSLAGVGAQPAILPPDGCDMKVLDRALDRVAEAAPQIKKRVLEACATTIGADGRVTVEEGELLRTIADSLDCPMPPLLAGHSA